MQEELRLVETDTAHWFLTQDGKAAIAAQMQRQTTLRDAVKEGTYQSREHGKLRQMFTMYDTEGTGRLDLSQFRLLLRSAVRHGVRSLASARCSAPAHAG